jgi:CAAX protease family protein
MNGPAWPEAQPWENDLFVIAAVVVVLLNRKAMLTRDQAVTEVLMPGAEQPRPEEAASTATS